MWEGKVYIVKKRGGAWREAYVKLPASAIPHLEHKQIVYVSTSPTGSDPLTQELLGLYEELFRILLSLEEVRKALADNPRAVEIIKKIREVRTK